MSNLKRNLDHLRNLANHGEVGRHNALAAGIVQILGMKTDQEKFMSLMKEFGVPVHHSGDHTTHEEKITICANDSDLSDKVLGYIGFIAEFKFTREGKFINVGVWE